MRNPISFQEHIRALIVRAIRRDFAFADLSGLNLARADLSHANLIGVNFTNTILEGANLQEAYFGDTNFTNADLTSADFRGAAGLRPAQRAALKQRGALVDD